MDVEWWRVNASSGKIRWSSERSAAWVIFTRNANQTHGCWELGVVCLWREHWLEDGEEGCWKVG